MVKPSDRFTLTTEGENIDLFSANSVNGDQLDALYGFVGVKEVVLQSDGKITVSGQNMKYRLNQRVELEGFAQILQMEGEGETKASFSYQNDRYYAKCDTGNFLLRVTGGDKEDQKDFTSQTEEVCVSVNKQTGAITIENAEQEAA